jgi:hypothetical protein
MKVTEINMELLNSISHVNNAIRYLLDSEETYQEYKYKERLQKSVDLVSEYISCFSADGKVSQRGRVPSCWNKNTIFETDAEKKAIFDKQGIWQRELDFSPQESCDDCGSSKGNNKYNCEDCSVSDAITGEH